MIPEIKKILYATDLSEGARRALGYAASIANRFGAGVTILHVIEDTSPYQDSLVMNILGEDRWQQLRAENEEKVISMIKDKVKNFCDEISKEMPACPFVTDDIIARIGHPVEEILKMAKDIQAAMLTAGCLMRQSSISAGPILYPALVITSSLRPTNQKYPSSSFFARSPVKSHFPRYFSLVASGFPQYSKNITGSGPCMAISPAVPGLTGLPSSSVTSTLCPGMGLPIDPGRTSITWAHVLTTRLHSVCP